MNNPLPPDILITKPADLLPTAETSAYAQGVAAGRQQMFVECVKLACGYCNGEYPTVQTRTHIVPGNTCIHYHKTDSTFHMCAATALRLANPDLSALMNDAK